MINEAQKSSKSVYLRCRAHQTKGLICLVDHLLVGLQLCGFLPITKQQYIMYAGHTEKKKLQLPNQPQIDQMKLGPSC